VIHESISKHFKPKPQQNNNWKMRGQETAFCSNNASLETKKPGAGVSKKYKISCLLCHQALLLAIFLLAKFFVG
jgi:hypothetical protein